MGVSSKGVGYLPREVSVWGAEFVSAQTNGGLHLPRTEFLTHSCENITLLQLLLWAVIKRKMTS